MRDKQTKPLLILQNAPKTKKVFAFDLDDTLIQAETLHYNVIFDKEEMSKIKGRMEEVIRNEDEVWIVTANVYHKKSLQKLFGSDSHLFLEKIKYFNCRNIQEVLGVSERSVHYDGKKGEFLAKKIAQDPVLKDFNVHCVLFDDSDKQIDGCTVHSSEKIKITGFRVDDYHARDDRRPAPHRPLSEVFSDFVNQSAIEFLVNEAQTLNEDLSELSPAMDENNLLFDNPNSPSLHLQNSIKNQIIAKPSTPNLLLENLVLGLAIGLFIVAAVIIITLATGGFGSPLALFLGGIGVKLALGALGGTAAFWVGLTVLSMSFVTVCTGLSGLANKLFSNCSPQNEKIADTNSLKIVNNPYVRNEFQPMSKSSQSGGSVYKSQMNNTLKGQSALQLTVLDNDVCQQTTHNSSNIRNQLDAEYPSVL